MEKTPIYKKITTIIIVLAAALGSSFLFKPIQPVHAAISNWQKSVIIRARWNTDYSSSSFQQSVQNAQSANVNYITLAIPLYQTNVNTTDVATSVNTPTDQSLTDGTTYAHALGLGVVWKMQVLSNDNQWSAYINPSDRTTWFNNYDALVVHYAQLAQADRVEQMVIGTEMANMAENSVNPTNTTNWNNLIAKVRAVYSGKLTYAANWGPTGWDDEKDNIAFWNNLDDIGIDAYFNLAGDGSVRNLVSDWQNQYASNIQALSTKWGKPIIFTEAGYKAITGSHNNPWMWWQNGSVDQTEQANDYTALFQFWNTQSYMQGVDLWYWSSDPNAGGPNDNDYSPQNKAAQQVMTSWFGGSGSGSGGSTSSGAPGGTFSASASSNPTSPAAGQQSTVAVNIKDTGSSASSNDLVDVEIYSSSGQQVLQQFYNNQNFVAGGAQTYQFNWLPSAAGNYILKTGVFSNDWSQNYYWGNDLLNISVGSGSSGSSGSGFSSSTINVWWPTNGASVTGVQPFKAMLTNADVSQYNMYWQVDGGQLNMMANNSTDYPHKEAAVDLTGWSWNGHGPYQITFVAMDLSGNVVAKQSVNIYVQ